MKEQELQLLNHNIRQIILNESSTKDNPAPRLEFQLKQNDIKEIKSTTTDKPVYYGQALLVSACGGAAYFINGFLSTQNFDVSCLYFTGFIFIELIFRYLQLKYEVKSFSSDAIKRTVFKNFFDFENQRVNMYYTFQVFMRACGLMVTYYCGIKSIYYAGLANLNFGIVSCCFIFSIIINVTCGLLFFDEKINLIESVGIIVIVSGIVWISLSKGQRPQLTIEHSIDTDEASQWNKLKSIFFALGVGTSNSSQTVHGKFMMKQKNYGIMNITADTVLIFIIMTVTITLINYFNDSTALNQRNFSLIFVSSSLSMICWLVGQNCSVKGRAGPTIAIIYTGCFFTTAFQAIFLAQIPTLEQFSAAILAFSGVIILIYGKETKK